MKARFFTLLALAADAPAVLANEALTTSGLGGPSAGVAVVRMLGSLAIVVAIFFAGAWLFKNMHRFQRAGGPPRKLQVLEGKSIGPRQALYVVAYEQQRLLIGATAQGLTLLTHLPDGAVQPAEERIVAVPFGEALMQALGRK